MAYPRPSEFTIEEHASIDAEKIKAVRAFRAASKKNRKGRGMTVISQISLLVNLCASVALKFGLIACRRGERFTGTFQIRWNVDQIEKRTIEFASHVSVDLFRDLLSMDISASDGIIDRKILARIQQTSYWDEFEDRRLKIAEMQAEPSIAPLADFAPPALQDRQPLWVPPLLGTKSETAKQLESLRAESRCTLQQIADSLAESSIKQKWDVSTVFRHESGKMNPQPWRVSAYEKLYSKLL